MSDSHGRVFTLKTSLAAFTKTNNSLRKISIIEEVTKQIGRKRRRRSSYNNSDNNNNNTKKANLKTCPFYKKKVSSSNNNEQTTTNSDDQTTSFMKSKHHSRSFNLSKNHFISSRDSLPNELVLGDILGKAADIDNGIDGGNNAEAAQLERQNSCIIKRNGRTTTSLIKTIFGIIILTTSLSISFISTSAHGCDKSQSNSDHHYHHQHHHHHLSRHYNGFRDGNDISTRIGYIEEKDAPLKFHKTDGRQELPQYKQRYKRHFVIKSEQMTNISESLKSISLFNHQQQQQRSSANITSSSSSSNTLDSIRIAALASKLEQWYTCHRLATNELLAAQLSATTRTAPTLEATAAILATDSCQAHFDGHLCWPAAKQGQLIKLPCPRLNWLSNVEQALVMQQREQVQPRAQEQQSVKSVINLIQLPTTTTTTTTATTIQSTASITEEAVSGNPLLTTSLDATNTKALVEEGERPISHGVSLTSKEGTTNIRFARRECIIGGGGGSKELNGDGKQVASNENLESYLMLNEGPLESLAGKKPPYWQAEADYSECSITSETFGGGSGGVGRGQHSSGINAKKLVGGEFDPTDKWVKLDQEQDRKLFTSLVEELERIEGAIDPYSDPSLLEQWTLCIGNTMRYQQTAHHHHSIQSAETNSSGLWCPIIFDGWRCWPSTKAGEIAYVSCPSNQPGFSAERKAHKICTSNGTWYRHPMTNRYWSNYTTCVDTVDLAFRRKILNLYIFGNLISLVALSASLIIFISFKNLNCTRVTIHKNLFLSFITNNLMWIIWYTYVVNDANLLQSNPIECQFWHILLHYFLISNYFWMFCEGLYLHTLLVVAFVSEDKILKWFYLLGWITPIPITVAYAYNRSYDEYYTNFCWMEESPYNLILMGPIVISLLLNLVFLINIVRVLVTKLRANNSPDTHQTRKAVRATLILIPLLGLHYILTPFRPEAKSEWEGIYEIFAAVCTSFQGLCVALLFCFCNGEVITVIKKKLKDTFNLNHHNSGNGDLNGRRNTLLKLNNNNNNKNNSNSINKNNNNSATISNNDSHTLRSVISFSSNGDIIAQQQQMIHLHQPILGTTNAPITTATAAEATTTNNTKTLSSIVNQRSNRINSNHSDNSSLLTTVTASPIQATQAAISSQAINDNSGGQQTETFINDDNEESLSATGNGELSNNDLSGSNKPRKLELSKNRPLNRKNSLSGPCLDKAETVHLLQGENNHDVLTTTTSFSVLT